MLTAPSAPDFETGFPNTREFWSRTRRIMLDGLVRFLNSETSFEGPEGASTEAQIQRGLNRIARMENLVAFKDHFGDPWRYASRERHEDTRARRLYHLVTKVYEYGAE